MARHQWTSSYIESEKQKVRNEVETWRRNSGDEVALNNIVSRLGKLRPQSDSDRLHIFFFGIYGLIIQRDSHFLNKKAYTRFAEHCRAALTLQGIVPGKSLLAFMYADVNALLGQISFGKGDHRTGAWYQLSSERLLRDAPVSSRQFHHLTLAQKYLRIGMLSPAEQLLDDLLQVGGSRIQDDLTYSTALINRIIVHRLKGEFGLASSLSLVAKKGGRLSDAAVAEVEWEELCRRVLETSNLAPMSFAIGKKGKHQIPQYIVQAALWDLAVGNGWLLKKGRTLETISHKEKTKFKKLGSVFEITSLLQNFLDSDMPAHLRIDHLTAVIDEISMVRTLDQEILLWMSVSRVLRRAQFPAFAELAEAEYEQLSFKLTGGHSKNILAPQPKRFD